MPSGSGRRSGQVAVEEEVEADRSSRARAGRVVERAAFRRPAQHDAGVLGDVAQVLDAPVGVDELGSRPVLDAVEVLVGGVERWSRRDEVVGEQQRHRDGGTEAGADGASQPGCLHRPRRRRTAPRRWSSGAPARPSRRAGPAAEPGAAMPRGRSRGPHQAGASGRRARPRRWRGRGTSRRRRGPGTRSCPAWPRTRRPCRSRRRACRGAAAERRDVTARSIGPAQGHVDAHRARPRPRRRSWPDRRPPRTAAARWPAAAGRAPARGPCRAAAGRPGSSRCGTAPSLTG